MGLTEILLAQHNVSVIDRNISYKNYVPLDLSAQNAEVNATIVADSNKFSAYLAKYLDRHNALAAFGGYCEKRQLYQRSDLFQDEETPRDVHIGLDIWTNTGTAVLAALDGKVHSFNYNPGLGNYGPTIVLEHEIDEVTFFTLYGHLSMESIEEIEIGDVVKKGQRIAELGSAFENGDYPPHLHFQIIADIDEWFGDYPGVCSASDLDFFLENCPDPNLLLKIQHTNQ